MIKPSTQRLTIILGSFLLLVGTVYVLVSYVYPTFLDIQELRAERQIRIDLKQTQDDAETKIGDLARQYASLATTQEAFSLMLPIGPEAPSLLNHLQGIARNNSLRVNTISFQYQPIKPSAATLVQGLGVLRATMALNGRYEDLKLFISQLETNVRIIDLNSLQINGGAVPRKDTFDYNVIADAYYQVEQ